MSRPITDYKRKAWRVFADWVINRDGNKCVLCGRTDRLQGSHFWHAVLDFDEDNISSCCIGCNVFKNGNLAVYAVYLLKKLGKRRFEALNARHYKALGGEKRTDEEFMEIIKKYSLQDK